MTSLTVLFAMLMTLLVICARSHLRQGRTMRRSAVYGGESDVATWYDGEPSCHAAEYGGCDSPHGSWESR